MKSCALNNIYATVLRFAHYERSAEVCIAARQGNKVFKMEDFMASCGYSGAPSDIIASVSHEVYLSEIGKKEM